jgi:hypothetical protein
MRYTEAAGKIREAMAAGRQDLRSREGAWPGEGEGMRRAARTGQGGSQQVAVLQLMHKEVAGKTRGVKCVVRLELRCKVCASPEGGDGGWTPAACGNVLGGRWVGAAHLPLYTPIPPYLRGARPYE